MKDDIVLTCIVSELSKIKLIIESKKCDCIASSIIDRLDPKDSEDTICKKIYDVLFFNFSGSHLDKNPIKLDDYILFARKIKLAIDKPEGVIGELLTNIADLNIAIADSENKTYQLHTTKTELIKKLRSICPHLQYIQYQECYTGDMARKCVVCCFEEKSKGNRPWTEGGGEHSFKKILGTEIKNRKLKDLKL